MSGIVPHCGWCKTTAGPLVEVGFVESNSGPGWFYNACQPCVDEHRIVPASEQPDTWLGEITYRAEATR